MAKKQIGVNIPLMRGIAMARTVGIVFLVSNDVIEMPVWAKELSLLPQLHCH